MRWIALARVLRLVRDITKRGLTAALVAAMPALASGCSSFATVRSADVRPGPSVALQASVSGRPGDVAGWFWSPYCAQACDQSVIGGDAGFTHGWRRATSGRGAKAFALGAGVNGLLPYVDGYLQLGAGRRPFGVGARTGLPITGWREHQLYGRYDVPLGGASRLLLNPAFFVHEGRSPNGENPGSFVAFVQGVGLQLEGHRVSLTPAVALVAGRAQRRSYGRQYGPARSVFGTASLGVTLHRGRTPKP